MRINKFKIDNETVIIKNQYLPATNTCNLTIDLSCYGIEEILKTKLLFIIVSIFFF